MLRGHPVTRASHAPKTASRRLHRQRAPNYVPLPHPAAKDAAPCTTSPTLRPRQCRGLLAAWRTDVPTYETMTRFDNDLRRLTPEQRRRFRRAVTAFVHDLRADGRFRAVLHQSSRSADSPASTNSPGPRAPARRDAPPGSTGPHAVQACSTSSGAASAATTSSPVPEWWAELAEGRSCVRNRPSAPCGYRVRKAMTAVKPLPPSTAVSTTGEM